MTISLPAAPHRPNQRLSDKIRTHAADIIRIEEEATEDAEIIVVDDGSTDGTRRALEPWLDDIRTLLTANRDHLLARVESDLAGVSMHAPEATYLAWIDCRELGLTDRVINPGGEATGTYVLDDGQPVALPLGPGAFLRTPLLSTPGKLRMLLEPLMPRKGDDADESLAAFVTRRLGREALERIAICIGLDHVPDPVNDDSQMPWRAS